MIEDKEVRLEGCICEPSSDIKCYTAILPYIFKYVVDGTVPKISYFVETDFR